MNHIRGCTKLVIDQALAHPINHIRIVRKFKAKQERVKRLGLRTGRLTILRDIRARCGEVETKRIQRSRNR